MPPKAVHRREPDTFRKFFFEIDPHENGNGYTVGAGHTENAATPDRVITIRLSEDF